jgi:hypothetical protein
VPLRTQPRAFGSLSPVDSENQPDTEGGGDDRVSTVTNGCVYVVGNDVVVQAASKPWHEFSTKSNATWQIVGEERHKCSVGPYDGEAWLFPYSAANNMWHMILHFTGAAMIAPRTATVIPLSLTSKYGTAVKQLVSPTINCSLTM